MNGRFDVIEVWLDRVKGLLSSRLFGDASSLFVGAEETHQFGEAVSYLTLGDFFECDRESLVGVEQLVFVQRVPFDCLSKYERFLALAAMELGESGVVGIVGSSSAVSSWRTEEVAALLDKYFGLVLPLKIDGAVLLTNDKEANVYCLREPRAAFPQLNRVETKSYRYMLAGELKQAWLELVNADEFRGESYPSVRYWNKLTLDYRESLATDRNCGGDVKGVIGLWDLRFVPHALGEYLYLIAVLQYVASELGVKEICVWCLAPGEERIRFDQKGLDTGIRKARVEQFRELSGFLPNGRVKFRLFEDVAEFDQEVVEGMGDWAVVPRFQSKTGGVFASYLHNYRFLSQVFEATGAPPYVYPTKEFLEGARSRMNSYRLATGKSCLIVTHLRYSALDSIRNVEIGEWVELFREVALIRPDVLFVVLGEGELEDLLIKEGVAGNCVFAGSEKLGVMSDFSLIHAADGFLGGPSGPAIVPLLSSVPYLFYKYKLVNELPYLRPPCPFPWATSHQDIHWLDHDQTGLTERFLDWLSRVKSV